MLNSAWRIFEQVFITAPGKAIRRGRSGIGVEQRLNHFRIGADCLGERELIFPPLQLGDHVAGEIDIRARHQSEACFIARGKVKPRHVGRQTATVN